MPRYHIDTIPIWDALHEQGECLLCSLRRRSEHMLAERYLGGSVMEPDTRVRVNQKGFCSEHHRMLQDRQNKLGHALMMLSRIKEVQRKLESLPAGSNTKAAPRLLSFLSKAEDGGTSGLSNLYNGCVLCDHLNENMRQYAYSMLHLWKTDKSFQEAFSSSKGLCLRDADLLLGMAQNHLSGQNLTDFQSVIQRLFKDNLARLEEELEWFTLKFDYRNSDKPWGSSRDALERTVNKLRGWTLGDDPGKEKQ
jgi:hypothetical protein